MVSINESRYEFTDAILNGFYEAMSRMEQSVQFGKIVFKMQT
jgi:hypothetical protein